MTAKAMHEETHLSYRAEWLRAVVLGANDGILPVARVVIGVAASGAGRAAVATAGVAALSAGAISMAAGEFVSVSSHRGDPPAEPGADPGADPGVRCGRGGNADPAR